MANALFVANEAECLMCSSNAVNGHVNLFGKTSSMSAFFRLLLFTIKQMHSSLGEVGEGSLNFTCTIGEQRLWLA